MVLKKYFLQIYLKWHRSGVHSVRPVAPVRGRGARAPRAERDALRGLSWRRSTKHIRRRIPQTQKQN